MNAQSVIFIMKWVMDMRDSRFTSEEMGNRIRRWMKQIGNEKPGSFACNLPARFVTCDVTTGTAEYVFHTSSCMENPWGVTHGGVLAMALDWAMGITSRAMLDEADTPTISMQIDYLHPVPLDCDMVIKVEVDHAGRTISHLQAKAYVEGRSECCVSASGHYYLRNIPFVLKDE